MVRKSILRLGAVILCMTILCGCAQPGPTVYTLGGVWETDGNAVSLVAASSEESYVCPDGTVLTPYEGELFLVVECSAKLAEGWTISDNLVCHRHHNGGQDGDYGLFCDPISLGGSEYILLFSVPTGIYTGEPGDYSVNMRIVKSESVSRIQEFKLGDA